MSYRYLIKDKQSLVHYYARNLATKGYVFYNSFPIPADVDAETIDAKLILLYRTNTHKQKVARWKKAGVASVKYIRLGRVGYLFATHGKSDFFTREASHKCAFDTPFSIGGYSISVDRKTGKVSIRIHEEAQKRIRKFIVRWCHKRPASWWMKWIRYFPFAPYSGVRDNLFHLIAFLNDCRKDFKQEPIDWKLCVRKKMSCKGELLQPSSKELLDLLRSYKAPLKSTGEAEKELVSFEE